MKFKLFLILLVFSSVNVLADTSLYSIQIAAVKNTSLNFYEQTTGFDTLYEERSSAGFMKIKLGPFSNLEEAEKNLAMVKNKGFSDAFISQYVSQLNFVSKNKHSGQIDGSTAPDALPVWARLTEEQRKNVVYLDGVLHVRVGADFKPISQF
jgi:hypothetical protein